MLNVLRKIVQDVTQQGSFAASVQLLAAQIKEALGTEVCSIYLASTGDKGYVLAATEGLNANRIGEVILNPLLGPRLKSGVVTTDMPITHDKPIDFGLQKFCDQCNKCFSAISTLKVHMDIHTGKTQCNCSANLRKHIKTHSGEKNHTCAQCNKSFNTAPHLKRHLLTHTGEKQHKCTQCNYSTNQAGNLRTHIMSHTGEKPHRCNQCDYSSTNSRNLTWHEATHSGEKPQKCTVCTFSSITTGNMRTHTRTAHAWSY